MKRLLRVAAAEDRARRFRVLLPSRRAVVLVLVLWLVVVLGVIASSLAFDVMTDSKLALLQHEQFIAYNLAKSAIAVGMTNLQNDLVIDRQNNPNQMYDALSDVWAIPPGRKHRTSRRNRDSDENQVVLDEDHPDQTYEVKVTDEEGRIPLNYANQKLLQAMLEYYGFEQPDSTDVANAIIDYRDQDDIAAGSPGDKEDEYYSAAMGQKVDADALPEDLIYRCANEQFLSTEQLLDIYGLNQFPEIYYGYDPDATSDTDMRIKQAAAKGRTARTRRERHQRGPAPLSLKDIVTVYPEGNNGRINLNTAPMEVLTILIHAATNFTDLQSAKASAEAICDFRGDGKKGKGPDPDDAFKSMADVAKVPGVDVGALQRIGSLGVQIVFKSETFRIVGTGRASGAKRTITAIVQRRLEVYNPDDARLASNKGKRIQLHRRPTNSTGNRKGEMDDNYIRIPAVRVIQWIE